MLPCIAALFSSAVPPVRLLEANFGTSGRVSTMEKWPELVRSIWPFGLGPKGSTLVPPWSTVSDTMVHVPTSCCWSLPVFWLPAALAAEAANAAPTSADNTTRLLVFMTYPLGRARQAARPWAYEHFSREVAIRPCVLLARLGRRCSCPALLDALPRHDHHAGAHRRIRIDELELVSGQLDRPLLSRSSPVGEGAALVAQHDRLVGIVRRVRSEVRDAALHHGPVLLRGPRGADVGGELGHVGTRDDQREPVIAGEDHGALRAGTEGFRLGASLIEDRGHQRPGPLQPLLERARLLIAPAVRRECDERQRGEAWQRHPADRLHGYSPWSRQERSARRRRGW